MPRLFLWKQNLPLFLIRQHFNNRRFSVHSEPDTHQTTSKKSKDFHFFSHYVSIPLKIVSLNNIMPSRFAFVHMSSFRFRRMEPKAQ